MTLVPTLPKHRWLHMIKTFPSFSAEETKAKYERDRAAILKEENIYDQVKKAKQLGYRIGTTVLLANWTDERVLVVTRGRDMHRYAAPGGKVENTDATIFDAARREVLEETGLKFTGTLHHCHSDLSPVDDFFTVGFVTSADHVDGAIRHSKEGQVMWRSFRDYVFAPPFQYWNGCFLKRGAEKLNKRLSISLVNLIEESLNKPLANKEEDGDKVMPALGDVKPEEVGIKHDKDKPRYDLLPANAIAEVVKVLTHGASKYAPGSWRKLSNPRTRYYRALQTHIAQWAMGEKLDKESGLHHLAHAACNVLFLLSGELGGFFTDKLDGEPL